MNQITKINWMKMLDNDPTSSILYRGDNGRFIIGIKVPQMLLNDSFVFAFCDISDPSCYQHLLTNNEFVSFDILNHTLPAQIALNYILPKAIHSLMEKVSFDEIVEVCSKDAVVGYWWIARCDNAQAEKIMEQTI